MCDVQGVAGVTALGESVIYMVLHLVLRSERMCLQGVTGGNALGEFVIHRVLEEGTAVEDCNV